MIKIKRNIISDDIRILAGNCGKNNEAWAFEEALINAVTN